MSAKQKKIQQIIKQVANEFNYTEEQVYQIYLCPWKVFDKYSKKCEEEVLEISGIGRIIPNKKLKYFKENILNKTQNNN
jgi:hypothetical protein